MKHKTMQYLLCILPLATLTATAQRKLEQEVVETEKAIYFPSRQKTSGDIEKQIQNLQFSQAEEELKKDIMQAKRKKRDTATLESQLERCNRGLQMLRGTDKVTIVDSVVVDKRNFLNAYQLHADLGKVRLSKDGRTTEYETQRGNTVYKSELQDGKLQLFEYNIVEGKLTTKNAIMGLDVEGDLNYPFLMSDGLTFYFAARSASGLGNYDIYVTRYDYDTDKYYKADNLGFPYNSYANDYLMVIDEENHIGWFASDRYQPNNKVCVYTFVPNTSRHPFDYENEDENTIINAASLHSIKATWNKDNEQARIRARQTLAFLKTSISQTKPYDFTLVINDAFTYHYYNDFRSAEAQKQCRDWMQKSSELNKANQQLETLRAQYPVANEAKRKNMKQQIADLEKQTERLAAQVHDAEKRTRNLELK